MSTCFANIAHFAVWTIDLVYYITSQHTMYYRFEGWQYSSFWVFLPSYRDFICALSASYTLDSMFTRWLPGDAKSCHVTHVTSCHVTSCHATSCHVMSCHATSCHVTPRHVTPCHVMSRHVMSCHVTWALPMLSTRAPRLEARYWVRPSLHLEVTRGCRGERGLEIMSRYCGNTAVIRRTHSTMTRGRCWGLWWPGGRVTWTRVPGSLQGAAILPRSSSSSPHSWRRHYNTIYQFHPPSG